MSILDWLHLNKRVGRLEKIIQRLEQENIAIMAAPFIESSLEEMEGEVIRGREIEEDQSLLDEDSVEEREYIEEQKWMAQRKQKAKMV